MSIMFLPDISVAHKFTPRKLKAAERVITIQRRNGTKHYIAPSDPLLTICKDRAFAEWIQKFLGE